MKQSHKLIVGDFNYKHIDWDAWSTSRNDSSNEQLFINSIQDTYCYQHISAPTRYREGEEPSILDLVFTNEEAMIQQIQHQSPLGKSDHSVLIIDFLIKQTSNFKPRTIYNYDKANYENMRNELNIDWEEELNMHNVNEQWNRIKTKLKESVKKHVPSYKTTEAGLWKKGKIPLNRETRKEIRKNTGAGSEHMRPNKKTRHRNGNNKETK